MFWTLNPRKLEPFRKKKEIEAKQHIKDLDFLAWRIGHYNFYAMGEWWGKNVSYPEEPLSMKEKAPQNEPMSDGARFGMWAAAHNAKKRQKSRG